MPYQNWQQLSYLIDDIETACSAAIVAIGAIVYIFKRSRALASVIIAMACWVLINFSMERLAQFYNHLSVNNYDVVSHVWYVTWVLFYTLIAVLTLKIHKLLKLTPGTIATFVCYISFLSCIMQAIRYIDRFVFDSTVTVELYKYGVLVLNISPSLMVILCLSRFFYKAHHKKHYVYSMRDGI